MVGICEVPEYAWYSHDTNGDEIEPRHKYAIVLLVDQGFETLDAASGDDWISNAQSFRAYMWGSNIASTVAEYIRQLGYEAQAHTNLESDVLHNPLVMLAGLGELSRIGEVVLNPFIGPRFKSSSHYHKPAFGDRPAHRFRPAGFLFEMHEMRCRMPL